MASAPTAVLTRETAEQTSPDTPTLQLQRKAHHGRMAAAIGRGVAHELRNVAQLVGMLRDALQQDPRRPKELMDAVTLAEATLMRQIGTLERLPPYPRHLLPISVADVVDRAIELIRRRRKGAKITFHVDVSRNLPTVMAVENDLDEAVWELLSNAREAAELRGQGTVTLVGRTNGTTVTLAVEDDGPGIPKTVQEQLFETFSSSHPCDDHLGIGLAMARQLVMQNGGTLEADLAVNVGARFVIEMPIKRAGVDGILRKN